MAFERMMAAFDRFDRRTEEFDRRTEEFDRRTKESQGEKDDLKTFIREIALRGEKVMQEQAKRTDEIVAELRDGRDERRAQTAALLAVVDRLPPPAQAA